MSNATLQNLMDENRLIAEEIDEIANSIQDEFWVDQFKLSLWHAIKGYGIRPIEDLWIDRLSDFDETLWIED